MIEAAAQSIASNLTAVRSRIERAASRARRDPASIRLVAVSKTFSADHVRAAAAAGLRDFGENRLQEALRKIEACRDLPLGWHLIGHLQSNKVRKAVGPFAVIHSVDGESLLRRLDEVAGQERRLIPVLVQVDLAGEETKFGVPDEDLDRLLETARRLVHVRLTGLMLLPPFHDDPEQTRPYFTRLRERRDQLVRGGFPAEALAELSMGMSHDFEVAIEEGATIVRVGSAIFGPRTAPQA